MEPALESALLFESPQEIYSRVFRTLRPGVNVPEVKVEFCAFANANSFIRSTGSLVHVRMSDLLESAPAPILEALAYILISKLYRRQVPAEFHQRYRRYFHRRDIRHRLAQLRLERGRKQLAPPQGGTYDLDEIFDEVNFRYFFGLMPKPGLGWSIRKSRVTLGHYDPSHNVIVISRLLDRPDVPRLVVEYVMFHEMLHVKYPVEHKAARRCVHTPDFKQAEKQFERLREAKEMIRRL